MITLITGTPGSGKTLYMVSKLAKTKEFEGRKIFVDGIRDLQIPTEQFADGHTVSNMHEWLILPEYHGSVVVIDEAQRIFPPRSAGSKAPPLVEFLHVHRHYGIDLYLITQQPKRIDTAVRDLVGAHYHVYKNKLGFRTLFYWDYCAVNPKSESRNAQASVYRLDESVYGLYKSAEIHTKIKQPKTRWLMAMPVAFAITCVSLYWAYGLIRNQQTSSSEPVQKNHQQTASAPYDAISDAVQIGQMQQQSLTSEMFVPKLAERPESKPIYDGIRQVKSYERVAGCVDSGSKCTCYSDQATQLSEITTAMCKDYVKNGMPFDPFRENNPEPQQRQQQPLSDNIEPQQQPTVLTLGGTSNVPKHQDYPERLRDIQ